MLWLKLQYWDCCDIPATCVSIFFFFLSVQVTQSNAAFLSFWQHCWGRSHLVWINFANGQKPGCWFCAGRLICSVVCVSINSVVIIWCIFFSFVNIKQNMWLKTKTKHPMQNFHWKSAVLTSGEKSQVFIFTWNTLRLLAFRKLQGDLTQCKIMLVSDPDVVGVDVAVWPRLFLWAPQDHPALSV